jgi:hypothetical protein
MGMGTSYYRNLQKPQKKRCLSQDEYKVTEERERGEVLKNIPGRKNDISTDPESWKSLKNWEIVWWK